MAFAYVWNYEYSGDTSPRKLYALRQQGKRLRKRCSGEEGERGGHSLGFFIEQDEHGIRLREAFDDSTLFGQVARSIWTSGVDIPVICGRPVIPRE